MQTQDTFDWEINFKIQHCKTFRNFSINDIYFTKTKDKEIGTLVRVKVSTQKFNLEDAREAASDKLNTLLDAYSILFGGSLSIEYVDYILLRVPSGTPPLFMPSRSETITITVLRPISKQECSKCKDLSAKIKTRNDSPIFERIISWYRKGFEERDPYFRFQTTWISFNALYNYFSNKRGEKSRIIDLLKSFLETNKGEPIFLEHSNDFIALSEANMRSDDEQINYSEELMDSINNKDYESIIIKGVVCIYGVRCNLFHGDEILSISSRKLVESSCRILDDILRKCVSFLL